MNKRIGILAVFCTFMSIQLVWGQCTSTQTKPAWVNGYFHEETNSYIETVSETGYTEREARNRAATIVIERRHIATGARMNVQVQGGSIIVSGTDELTVKARVIDEYREVCNGQHRVYLLVQTAKNPTYEYERVRVTESYGFSPRVFVPGMAQLHMGSKMKGGLIIAGEALFVGGIIFTESMRASNQSKFNSTHDANAKKDYLSNADNYENARNIMIGGAAILYLYNIIDGIASKGKKQVIIGNHNIKISPYVSPDAGGFHLSFNF